MHKLKSFAIFMQLFLMFPGSSRSCCCLKLYLNNSFCNGNSNIIKI